MKIIDSEMLWRQFGAAIDMLGSALRDCPDDLWEKPLWGDASDEWIAAGGSKFWYLGSHALFWLEFYLTGAEEGFAPPEPFDLSELDPRGAMPRLYSRAELLTYLDYCREKCHNTIIGLTDEQAARLCPLAGGKVTYPFGEMLLYNLRHVQEHGAQLNMFLGQQAGRSAKWARKA